MCFDDIQCDQSYVTHTQYLMRLVRALIQQSSQYWGHVSNKTQSSLLVVPCHQDLEVTVSNIQYKMPPISE